MEFVQGDAVRFGDIELALEEEEQLASASYEPTRKASVEQKRIGLVVTGAVAAAALAIVGFGIMQLLSKREAAGPRAATHYIAPSDARSTPEGSRSTRRVITPGRDYSRAASDGVSVAQVGEALVRTDLKHAADHLWIRLESIEEVCTQGGFPPESLLCREAYLARHAHDREHGVEESEIAVLCSRGMIDQTFDLCSKHRRKAGPGS